MSIRAIWVVKLPSTNNKSPKNIFFRKFPTVEKKTKQVEGSNYIAIPNSPQFLQQLLVETGLSQASGEFVGSRDQCSKQDEKPVFEVDTSSGRIWPFIVIEQQGVLYCCLVHVPQGAHLRPNIIEIPSVSLGFSLLCGVAEYIRAATSQELPARLTELHNFLNEAAPFGAPRDTCCESIVAKLAGRPITLPKSQKQPAWKPLLHKGKGVIYLSVSEYIKAAQCEQGETHDSWDVYGSVSCRADLEGALSDITLNVSHQSDGDCVALDHLLIHPCVQSADSGIVDAASMTQSHPPPRRLRFIPPTEMFILCQYSVTGLQELPIFGVYQMKCDAKIANLTVKLKLNNQVKNMFEYCEVQIPFFNRGSISMHDSSPSQGSVTLAPDKTILVWNVGQKFPSKTLEVTMSANIQFSGPALSPSSPEDRFCSGQSSYAQLYFKIPEFTQSGCCIDPRSIQVSPSAKFKLTTVREYLSTDYKIWNSYGDVLSTSE
ncbi:AP-5 complex subunit mu-1-like [Haliotis rufescens]|uniref:AP-5 complex subunit mu-1-like n=1 Tax=Haliotis rufescens TaxID=6454 RepID=UPI001EAFA813|nr:AP-5 complex subunit mu-1-like [Haliotis rufescens]